MERLISSVEGFLHNAPVPIRPLHEMLEGVPHDINDFALKSWDFGVFNNTLIAEDLAPDPTKPSSTKIVDHDLGKSGNQIPGNITKGTYAGSQLAVLEMFQRIEGGYASYFAAHGVETDIPLRINLDDKKKMYQYQPKNSDHYPPHLNHIPWEDQTSQLKIFNILGLAETALLLPKIIPDTFTNKVVGDLQSLVLDLVMGKPQEGATMKAIYEANKTNRKSGTDIMRGANIGDYEDWYTDARFAQQFFTGTNPTTIEKASDSLFTEFVAQAKKQERKDIVSKLTSASRSDLYVNDCSWFRKAIGFTGDKADKELLCVDPLNVRYACAAVTLFELHNDGKLHPLAIVIDYKISMDKSVVIFNRRLDPSDSTRSEQHDWPWRYAKTCAMTSDWMLHELLVHLGRTHLVEEATIVATHRCIPDTHIIFQLLNPHWIKTLSLNAAARATLVPKIIVDLVGIEPNQAYDFILYDYHNFDWTKRYVPNDLDARGFPHEKIKETKYRNYGYARDISLMWKYIREYVAARLDEHFPTDKEVAADPYISDWCKELQSDNGAQIKSFPTITTRDQLIDAVTMCIHLASPQHTSINYLQNFYQAFVVNRPGSLFTPLPTTLAALKAYKELNLVQALPIDKQRQWLLLATIPWLLSFRPSEDKNLINYAASVYNAVKTSDSAHAKKVRHAAEKFYFNLRTLIKEVKANSDDMTSGCIPYTVLDPNNTAVAIII